MPDTPPQSPSAAKHALRSSFLARREAIPDELREDANKALFRRLTTWSVFEDANSILTYVSTPSEADTHRVIEAALKLGKGVGVPRITKAGLLQWHEAQGLAELKPGAHGILEPELDSPAFGRPLSAHLVLVPGVAFAPNGHRIGRGDGYFDRFLPDFTGIKVGLAYDEQMAHELPTEPHDVPLDFILTPTRTIDCR